jgi:hypothetical protein
VGPSIAQFGVTNTWADPDIQLYQGSSLADVAQVHYSDWIVSPEGGMLTSPVPGFQRLLAQTGAFPLLEGSKDAAAVFRLSPGNYTVVANPSAGDAGGEVLIEVYFLP